MPSCSVECSVKSRVNWRWFRHCRAGITLKRKPWQCIGPQEQGFEALWRLNFLVSTGSRGCSCQLDHRRPNNLDDDLCIPNGSTCYLLPLGQQQLNLMLDRTAFWSKQTISNTASAREETCEVKKRLSFTHRIYNARNLIFSPPCSTAWADDASQFSSCSSSYRMMVPSSQNK